MTTTEDRAAMSSAAINDLPDSAFAYIEPGGSKDSQGKTVPRSNRHFPVHDAAHVRNALARLSSSPFGPKAKAKVLAAARKFGIHADSDGDSDDHGAPRVPFELRRRRRAGMCGGAERRGMLLEVRAKPDGTGGTDFVFEGYASLFNEPFQMWDRWGDPYIEVVMPGAFTRTLARPDLDVPFLIGHDDKRLALARTRNGTMQLSQDSTGVLARAVMDGRRSDVRDLAYAVERGDNDEMSIGFVTREQEWSDDYETRSMLDLDLHRGDVSAVALAANPAVTGASMTELTSWRHPSREGRANPVDQNLGESPDYNPWAGTLPHVRMTGTHAHTHENYGGGPDEVHGHMHTHNDDNLHNHHNAGGSAGQDGRISLDEAGIPQSESPNAAAVTYAQGRDGETLMRQLRLLRLQGGSDSQLRRGTVQ